MVARNPRWLAGITYPRPNAQYGSSTTRFAINFLAVEYSNKQPIRENSPGSFNHYADITLPLPRNIRAGSEITYTRGAADIGGAFDWTTQGAGEAILDTFGLYSGVKDLTGISAHQGQRPMDQTDSVFQGSEFRQHRYEWTLVPKEEGDGEEIMQIAKAFQTLAYPMRSGDLTFSRVVHPPVWFINVMEIGYVADEETVAELEGIAGSGTNLTGDGVFGQGKMSGTSRFRFDMSPLPSVLASVDIQTQGAAQGSWVAKGGFPAATLISVTFKELEPAVNMGNGLGSRSQVRTGEIGQHRI